MRLHVTVTALALALVSVIACATAPPVHPRPRDDVSHESRYPRPLSVNPLYAEAFVSYQMRCAPCHGADGNARGPVARYFMPAPRDFSAGLRPFDQDLARAIREGVHGSVMPQWGAHLTELEIDGLVRYIKTFSRAGRGR